MAEQGGSDNGILKHCKVPVEEESPNFEAEGALSELVIVTDSLQPFIDMMLAYRRCHQQIPRMGTQEVSYDPQHSKVVYIK